MVVGNAGLMGLLSLTELNCCWVHEGRNRNRKVARRRTFANTAGRVVVRPVAWAEPTTESRPASPNGTQPRCVHTPICASQPLVLGQCAVLVGCICALDSVFVVRRFGIGQARSTSTARAAAISSSVRERMKDGLTLPQHCKLCAWV